MYPSFYFCFGFFHESRQLPGAGSSLRSAAGLEDFLEDVLDASCDGDVEDELVPDLNWTTLQGQPQVRNFPFCIKIVFPCLVRCGF